MGIPMLVVVPLETLGPHLQGQGHRSAAFHTSGFPCACDHSFHGKELNLYFYLKSLCSTSECFCDMVLWLCIYFQFMVVFYYCYCLYPWANFKECMLAAVCTVLWWCFGCLFPVRVSMNGLPYTIDGPNTHLSPHTAWFRLETSRHHFEKRIRLFCFSCVDGFSLKRCPTKLVWCDTGSFAWTHCDWLEYYCWGTAPYHGTGTLY